MSKKLLRPKVAAERLGVGHSKFWNLVKEGRIKLVRIGPKSVAVVDSELDALIDEMITERDHPQPAA
jgi:excisionase family DNA binding protein